MTLISKISDRLHEKEIVRTNDLGAETWKVGNVVEWQGVRYRITRHRVWPTTPWATYVVYGRRA